jgi:hypothetical protein
MRKKKIILLTIISGLIILFSQCLNFKKDHDSRGKAYAGSAACFKCHQSICESYAHTAHFHSAGPASSSAIKGSFAKDSNSFLINDTMKVVMEKRNGIPYQVLYISDRETEAHPFDIVFGYAKGQTYLYWKDDVLFQLPISYFTNLKNWSASPGFPGNKTMFERPIYERCFECHTSYAKQTEEKTSGLQNIQALDRNSIIYSIDCERCHGPAATHVAFHTEYPQLKQGAYIISCKSLSRTQKMDMCGVCHSGNRTFMLGSAFAFRPGDTLAHSIMPRAGSALAVKQADEHGNQSRMLTLSKCYMMSEMDCSTCHNPHVNDRGNGVQYDQRCQSCHAEANHNFCKLADSVNTIFLKNNCTKCHMPEQPFDILTFKTSATTNIAPISIVNHRIAIYPAESKEILGSFREIK